VVWLGKSTGEQYSHELQGNEVKMDKRRKLKNVNNEKGRKNYRSMRNGLRRSRGKAKKKYLENRRDEITEFQRTGRYGLICVRTAELSWKENHGIQNADTADSQRDILVDQRKVPQNWEHYITGLHG
jgi:hypothetical protein